MPSVDHTLFRQHVTRGKKGFAKDLSRLGRSLENVLIIDNDEENFRLQKENGIHLTSWTGEAEDIELLKLEQILRKIPRKNPSDLRRFIRGVKIEEVKLG